MRPPAPGKPWPPPRTRTRAGNVGGVPATGAAFRTQWIHFGRGIRVGNLEPHERITQILKRHLQERHGQPFLCDRWGRGSFWQWICWVARLNRDAKPISHAVNWSCAKFFLSVDQETRVLKAGGQVERGPTVGPAPFPGCVLGPDWDWHRFAGSLRAGGPMERELSRLLRRNGFVAELGDWERTRRFDAASFRGVRPMRTALGRAGPRDWVAFQLYYPFPESEVRSMKGPELVRAIEAVFAETTPAMDQWMQVSLGAAAPPARPRWA